MYVWETKLNINTRARRKILGLTQRWHSNGRKFTITGEYYSTLLDQLDVKIREMRPGLKKKKIISLHKVCAAFGKCRLHENAQMTFMWDRTDVVRRFATMNKIWVSGKRFASNEQDERAVDETSGKEY